MDEEEKLKLGNFYDRFEAYEKELRENLSSEPSSETISKLGQADGIAAMLWHLADSFPWLKLRGKKVWELENGDTVYSLDTFGNPQETIWENTSYNKFLLEQGTYFLTKEDARIEMQKRQVEFLLERYGGVSFRKCSHFAFNDGVIIQLSVGPEKDEFFIKDVNEAGITIEDVVPFLFETIEAAEYAIEGIGKKRLADYLKGTLHEEKENVWMTQIN